MGDNLVQLSSLRAKVRALLQHTRDVDNTELDGAINYGYGKAIKAILATRPESFLSFRDAFTLAAGVKEYDVSGYDPPVLRPVRLLAAGGNGSRGAMFRYRSMVDGEVQGLDADGDRGSGFFYYDFLTGMLPGTARVISAAMAGSLTLDSVTDLEVGSCLSVPLVGPVVSFGGETFPGIWTGIVTSIAGLVVTVEPDFTVVPIPGALATPQRRRLMVLSPAPSESVTGRLFYNYRPARLVRDTDVLDAIVAEHEDLVVTYALAILGRAVGDSNAARWWDDAEGQRSELMQDADPTGIGSASFGSDLIGMGDW